MVPFERALVTSYRPSNFTRFRDIAPCVLQHATFPHQPLVSRKFSFPMFPWKLVDALWATKSEGVRLIVRSVSFQDF